MRAVHTAESILEDVFAVIGEEAWIWLGKLVRKLDAPAFVETEVPLQARLGEKTFQPLAKDEAEFLIEGDQTSIEAGIMKRRKTQTVARVQALGREVAPWFDVTGDEQARHRNTSDATAAVVGVEDCLTKKLLASAHFDCGLCFCRSARGNECNTRFKLDLLWREKINLLVVVRGEQIMEKLFALRRKRPNIGLKLIPHQPVLLRYTGKPTDTTCALHRVERSKVAQLHRQTVRRSPHLLGNFNNDRVVPVQFAKRQLAVEVQRDEFVLARPFHGGSF